MVSNLSGKSGQIRLGLTGGIGSGKSTVAAMLVDRGAVLVDTDAISRSITAPSGAAIAPLVAQFGSAVIDDTGALDRAQMRELVFSDPTAKLRLEAIVHPLIGAAAMQQADLAGGAIVVFDVPLLAESVRWRARCQRIVVVDCSAEMQVRRVVARSGWSAEQVAQVIKQQSTRERRRAIADAVLHNDGVAIDELARQVDRLWEHWCGRSAAL